MATAKNTGKQNPAMEVFDPANMDMDEIIAGLEEQQTGFPPYWNPAEGNGFKAKVIARDERDPEFHRYVLEATVLLKCANGPAEDAEEVIVQPGEYFTCSVYASLDLEKYAGEEVVVLTKRKRKLAATAGNSQKRDMWEFRVLCSPETAKRVKARLQEQSSALANKRAQQLAKG